MAQKTGTLEKAPHVSVTYRFLNRLSAIVRKDGFAKQLRLARHLAGASLGRSGSGKVSQRERGVTKPKIVFPYDRKRSYARTVAGRWAFWRVESLAFETIERSLTVYSL